MIEKMRHTFTFLMSAAFCLALPKTGFALPLEFSRPPGAFHDADRDGSLLVVDDLRSADFGGGLRFPIRWVFRGNDQSTNAYGWDGFSLTALEAKAVKKTSTLYEVTFLCGKVVYFGKQASGVTPGWKSNDTQWGGVEDTVNNKFTVTRWDGWVMEFKDGRIKKLVTEDNRTLNWTYDSTDSRLVTEIKEVGEDPVVEIEISNNPLHMAGSSAVRGAHKITVNGDVYTFKYSGGTLQDIEFPDDRKTQWRFEQNGSNPNEKRLTVTQESGWWRSWVFFNDTRKLKTDDVWSYSITGGEPAEDGVVYGRPSMECTRIATGEMEKVQYQAANSIEIFTDVLGNITQSYKYKTPGKLYDKHYKIERKKSGGSGFVAVWRGVYNSETGDIIRTYDANDNEVEYVYERFLGSNEFQPPKKVTVTDPLGRISSVTRDEDGNIVETVNTQGVKREFEWDSRRRLTKVKDGLDHQLLRYVYGDKNEILNRYDASNGNTECEYQTHLGEALLTKVTSPEGRVVQFVRDSKGRVTKLENPAGAEWDFTYVNNWNAIETVTDPNDQETAYEYDVRLNKSNITDALGGETELVYDDLDLPVELTDALNHVTGLEWNANGDLKKVIDARSKSYTMEWESKGKRESVKWPDNVNQTATYDDERKVVAFHPRGTEAIITNSRNSAGELSGQGWVNGTYSGTINIARDSVGQVVEGAATAMSLTVSGSYAYDNDGRVNSVSQKVGGVTRSASVTYDLNGAVSTITYPAGFVVEYLRNGDGQVTAIKKNGATIAGYTYDGGGRLSARSLSSGVITNYTYDGANRVNQIVVSSGTNVLWAERYGYNALGQRVFTLKGSSGNIGDAYSLDAVSQLAGVKYGATGADSGYGSATSPVGAATWTYDAGGNRQTQVVNSGTTAYTVNSVNQYTGVSGGVMALPSYTSRGDLASFKNLEFAYDAHGNLIQAHNTVSNMLAKYWRDAFGHRAVKEVDGVKTVFLNMGYIQLESYDFTSGLATSTIFEPGIDRPLAQVGSDGSLSFLHQDWLGSVVMQTGSNGAKEQSYSYDSWGRPSAFDASDLPISNSAIESKFLYAAREFDSETDLYHCRARAYSFELGRFVQFDPIDFSGGDSNLSRYVSNNPMNLIDPFGTFSWPSVVAVVGGIASVALFPTYPVIAVGVGVVAAGFLIYDLYDTFSTHEALEDIVTDSTDEYLDTIKDLSTRPSDPTLWEGGERSFRGLR